MKREIINRFGRSVLKVLNQLGCSMKLKKSYKLLIAVALEWIILGACKNPLDGFQLLFKEPIEKAKLEIRFSSTTGKLPDNIKLTITGKDADKIVTNLNTKNFKINKEGIIFLAVDPEILPSTQAPITFTIVAEAEGFTKLIKEFTFTGTGNQFYSPRFFNIATPPTGVSANQFKLSANANGEITKSYILKPEQTNKQENALVSVREGTTFLNTQKQVVTGEMDFVIHHFDNRSGISYLPEGGIARNPVDKNNINLPDAFNFSPVASFAAIEISSNKQEVVRSFSKPIAVTFELNPNTVNPDTKAAIKVGDSVPLISYSPYTGVWKVEGNSTIVKNTNTGKLECTAEISYPAYWINGWPRWLCKQGPAFTIKSNFKDVDLSYYCVLVNAKTGNTIASYYINLNNNAVFRLSNMPKETEETRLKLFNFNNIYGGDRNKSIFESSSFNICESKSFSIDVTALPVPPAIELEFDITCPRGKKLDEASIPSQMKTQFSEPGKNQWINMPTITRNATTAKTYMLRIGQKYDLRASTDGGVNWPYKQNNYLIDKKKWAFEILGDELGYCK
ncbi:hypothetical protein [Emticicia agri]|uniref:Uncharacterized protein n=1 Tax=Emticicia agri TaxID=2492393 RepID=A0A4Q5LW25_9BACT|nr:hypothetical protein [Emticicia agri]RYU93737.1 hypothetical protein EWM59_20680 [Emticicia agri]